MTANSRLWFTYGVFFPGDFMALTAEREHWVVDKSIKLIEVNYLSEKPLEGKTVVHYILLEARQVLLEGSNLNGIESDK